MTHVIGGTDHGQKNEKQNNVPSHKKQLRSCRLLGSSENRA